jgi:hypothetical protein
MNQRLHPRKTSVTTPIEHPDIAQVRTLLAYWEDRAFALWQTLMSAPPPSPQTQISSAFQPPLVTPRGTMPDDAAPKHNGIHLNLSTAKGLVQLSSENIICCTALGKNTRIMVVGDGGENKERENKEQHKELVAFHLLKDLETFTEADCMLFRCHKSYLVNLRYVEAWNEQGCCIAVTMRNGEEVTIAKSAKKEFRQRMKMLQPELE